MLFLKIFFENVLFCFFLAFILNALEKDKLPPLIIYFAVSYLAPKHNKSGVSLSATAEPAHYVESCNILPQSKIFVTKSSSHQIVIA